MAGVLSTFDEDMATDSAGIEYPGARKLAAVVSEFWGALTIDGCDGDTLDSMEAMVTQEFARALFGALFPDRDALEAVLSPRIRLRDDKEG